MAEYKKQEAAYEQTFRDGKCTFGDMNYKRHRDVRYSNEYPAGETSGIYEILIMPDIEEMTNEKLEYDDLILLIGDGFGKAEVFISELDILY